MWKFEWRLAQVDSFLYDNMAAPPPLFQDQVTLNGIHSSEGA